MTGEPSPELTASVRRLIAKQLNVAIDRVLAGAQLVDDLQADVSALTQLALALEEEFNVEIADAEWAQIRYVSHVIACVQAAGGDL